MLGITGCQRNAKETWNEIQLSPLKWLNREDWQTQVLVKMWSKWNTHLAMAEMQNGTAPWKEWRQNDVNTNKHLLTYDPAISLPGLPPREREQISTQASLQQPDTGRDPSAG